MPGLFPTLSTGASFCYPVERTINTRSVTNRFCDLSEQSYRCGTDFVLTEFVFTSNRISTADKNTIREFYAAQNGEEATDWSLLFDGVLYIGCQFIGLFVANYVDVNLWSVVLNVRTRATTRSAIINLLHGAVVSATLTVVTSYIPSNALTPSIGAEISTSPVGLFSPADWIESQTGWSQRVDSRVIDPATVMTGGTRVLFGLDTNIEGGTSLTNPDRFLIYDAYVSVVYEDGTTGSVRPGISQVITHTTQGSINNAALAVDGDPATFAEIYRTAYSALSTGNFLAIDGFVQFLFDAPTP